eukprot:TRINITY_DN24263_c0_g1_i6.p1 TRINITY_DN24263_c0_g1~~TRINITY_DN24263_c0_g1_i6.p1  ORF type:complete len:246 (+),score=68.26 TRINITY_DN24263_c0_g1_i6:29-766(+)
MITVVTCSTHYSYYVTLSFFFFPFFLYLVFYFFFFFKQKTAYEMLRSLVGSEMCIRDRYQRRVRGNIGFLMAKVLVRRACAEEADRIFAMVNDAYAVEKGDSGLAFKTADRYIEVGEVVRDVEEAEFLVAVDTESPEEILGCINVSFTTEPDGAVVGHYGPFAVSPHAQGRGVGTALLAHLNQFCTEKGACRIDIEVVNWRTDLASFYGKRGYQKVGEAPCDAAHNCDESQVTRPSHFILMSYQL